MQADETLPRSTAFDFSPDADLHSYSFGVDPITGITVYVSSPSVPVRHLTYIISAKVMQHLTQKAAVKPRKAGSPWRLTQEQHTFVAR